MKTKQLFILIFSFLLVGLISDTCNAQIMAEECIVPNVFTPNNDGVNDTFKIDNLNGSWKLMIFDRWGSLVFGSEQGQGTAWNGVNLQGYQADEGVYFYTLINESTGKSCNGSLHLFR